MTQAYSKASGIHHEAIDLYRITAVEAETCPGLGLMSPDIKGRKVTSDVVVVTNVAHFH